MSTNVILDTENKVGKPPVAKRSKFRNFFTKVGKSFETANATPFLELLFASNNKTVENSSICSKYGKS